jgi:outer membrane protein TolC
LFDRNQGEIARARATRQQLFDEYVARLAETRADVAQLVSAWSVAGRQLRAAEADLPGLETVGRAMARQLSEHTTDILSYRDAQRALLSQRLECARLRQNRIEIGVALSIATGRPSLTPQPSPSTP